jgi:hypothetical protein
MSAKLTASVLAVLTMVFYACQKEIGPYPETPTTACHIDMGYYYGGSGGINDSVAFTYTGNRVTRAEGRDDIVTYRYDGENIIGRSFYEKPGMVFWSVDSISYDAANRVSRIVNWSYPSSYTYDTTREEFRFYYVGNKLSLVKEYSEIVNYYIDSAFYTFYPDAAGNLQKFTIGDGTVVYDSVLYQFDNNPNYFRMAHPHFYLFDPFFELQVGLISHMPYFYSTNNVTNFNVYGSFDYPIVYGLDSLQNVTSLDMGGFEYIKYRYSCQ